MSPRDPWPSCTALDWRTFGRCVGASLAVAALALVVLASTDADHPSWWARIARLSAMSPVFGCIGTGLGMGQAKARGEWLALASVGVSPFRASLGLLAGAWLTTAVGAIGASLPLAELGALFPAVPQIDWVREGEVWLSPSAGIRLGPGLDAVGWTAPVAAGQPLAPLRGWVVAAIGVAGLWMPVWLLVRCGIAERLMVAFAAVAAQLWAFHVVAATQGRGWILLSGSAVLLVHGLLRSASSDRAGRCQPGSGSAENGKRIRQG